jgi:hypothetical protein
LNKGGRGGVCIVESNEIDNGKDQKMDLKGCIARPLLVVRGEDVRWMPTASTSGAKKIETPKAARTWIDEAEDGSPGLCINPHRYTWVKTTKGAIVGQAWDDGFPDEV